MFLTLLPSLHLVEGTRALSHLKFLSVFSFPPSGTIWKGGKLKPSPKGIMRLAVPLLCLFEGSRAAAQTGDKVL